MEFEVEQKFRVSDLSAILGKLRALGGVVAEQIAQVDRYFAHPERDFASTDEALRLRQVGSMNFITYKGPKIDRVTKTRREIELPLGDGEEAAGQWAALLQALGFRPVTEVRKLRQPVHLPWQGAEVEIALDQVAGVGSFVELELGADHDTLEAAKTRIHALAAALELTQAERRSYLELLLAARRSASETAPQP